MSKSVYDKLGNEIILSTNDDFEFIKLYEGEYHGGSLLQLSIDVNLDAFSEIVFVSKETNPKVATIHPVPFRFWFSESGAPYSFLIKNNCNVYMYNENRKALWVNNLTDWLPNSYIHQIYGIKRPKL